ncbi:uncharacterized protein LOC127149492 isoform X1 [Cucumis melo]|uniref:Uncharacterized protein LOC127149492 isoform X1 n=1 Tax=Cucumis melo TaxID=3656 RepID=A0ABM3KTS8_CUCME|nr:uncharacterized protein LOC127149492 isoform X1 [Cucumis melo]XP_050941178.1 uncharacterized protein LOC127149492 isoform X1 [Cucumis melo]
MVLWSLIHRSWVLNKMEKRSRFHLIQGEDEVSVVPLNEPLSDFTDEDIREFASFIGGSYVADASKTLNGEFTVTDAVKINLPLSKDLKNAKAIVDWIDWAEPQYDFNPIIDEWCQEAPE